MPSSFPINQITSDVPGKAPQPADLVKGQLAINLADRALYTKDENDQIIKLGDEYKLGFELQGVIHSPEQAITAAAMDLSKGAFWSCGAIVVPAPTNAQLAMSGLIRCTAVPLGWNVAFKFPDGVVPTMPGIVPFYVKSATEILCGSTVEVS